MVGLATIAQTDPTAVRWARNAIWHPSVQFSLFSSYSLCYSDDVEYSRLKTWSSLAEMLSGRRMVWKCCLE